MNAISGRSNGCKLPNPRGRHTQPKSPPKPAQVPDVELEAIAVYDSRGRNASRLATIKARASAWGRGQNATARVQTLEVVAATKT